MTQGNKSKLDEILGKLKSADPEHLSAWFDSVDEFIDGLTPEEYKRVEEEVTKKEKEIFGHGL